MKKYVCPVCGYVYEGDELPEGFKCPICGVSGEKFQVVEGDLKLAAEHEFGIGTKLDGVPEEDKKFILDQLKANFSGECSEVGMYLCMARIAHREGYPEIGLYWEKAAYEEAEHAAKFAELLGSELEPNMTASTKKNLAWRVECEFGATAGKVELAKVAKKNNLDAIHDTVHEMARDEARHGKALKGLLERYFGGVFPAGGTAMKYVCDVCGYVYDPAVGDPENGVAPGTPWEEVPEDWLCPLCAVGKDQFSPEA